jgi:hypothetical protein
MTAEIPSNSRPSRLEGRRAMTDTGRYVKMPEIREACLGHEEEILDKLGVPFRNGAPHICCPYPDHPDKNPSWRWDNAMKRAFCTCIGRRPGEKKAHELVNVVACTEGLNFSAVRI